MLFLERRGALLISSLPKLLVYSPIEICVAIPLYI
jgi:hypothetical protein